MDESFLRAELTAHRMALQICLRILARNGGMELTELRDAMRDRVKDFLAENPPGSVEEMEHWVMVTEALGNLAGAPFPS